MQPPSPAQWKVLGIRMVLGMFLAVLLTRFFLPRAGLVAILAAAVLLVAFAYLFESVRKR
jgi:hypothetical protein